MHLKAMIKKFEDMPPDSKCCEASNQAMRAYCETGVILKAELVYTKSTCCYCGTIITGPGFDYAFDKYSIRQDMIDIYEGPVN